MKEKHRIEFMLEKDKIVNPQFVCQVLKDELKPIISNYLSLNGDIQVRFKKENNKNIFFIEIDADRVKPFGYIPS